MNNPTTENQLMRSARKIIHRMKRRMDDSGESCEGTGTVALILQYLLAVN